MCQWRVPCERVVQNVQHLARHGALSCHDSLFCSGHHCMYKEINLHPGFGTGIIITCICDMIISCLHSFDHCSHCYEENIFQKRFCVMHQDHPDHEKALTLQFLVLESRSQNAFSGWTRIKGIEKEMCSPPVLVLSVFRAASHFPKSDLDIPL